MQGGSWRATWGKLALSRSRRLGDGLGERVRRTVGDDLFGRFRSAGVLEWLPVADYAQLTAALVDVLGVRGARSLWRDTLVLGLETPLLRPLVVGTRALHGRNPGQLFRRSREAWALIARDSGSVEVTVDEPAHAVRVTFSRFDAALRSEAIVAVFHGSAEAVLHFLGASGRISEQLTELAHGSFALDVTWTRDHADQGSAPRSNVS